MDEKTPANELQRGQASPPPIEHDWFLQQLTTIVNAAEGKMDFGITLTVGGFLVSGNLSSGKGYFEAFANDFAGAFRKAFGDGGDEIREALASHSKIYESAADGEAGASEPRHPPAYIHLRDARFFDAQGRYIPGPQGVWWRGRICEVSGFFLGSISHN